MGQGRGRAIPGGSSCWCKGVSRQQHGALAEFAASKQCSYHTGVPGSHLLAREAFWVSRLPPAPTAARWSRKSLTASWSEDSSHPCSLCKDEVWALELGSKAKGPHGRPPAQLTPGWGSKRRCGDRDKEGSRLKDIAAFLSPSRMPEVTMVCAVL